MSMTRGGGVEGMSWEGNGVQGIVGGGVARKGLNQPKPMMTRVCQNPPRKKNPKKIFRGPTFFSRIFFLRVWGVSVIVGFWFKTKPMS